MMCIIFAFILRKCVLYVKMNERTRSSSGALPLRIYILSEEMFSILERHIYIINILKDGLNVNL